MSAPGSPRPDDLVTCLAVAVAPVDRPPKIVTVSGGQAKGLMNHVFGPGSTANLVARSPGSGPLAAGAARFVEIGEEPVLPLDFAASAVLLRFADPKAFGIVMESSNDWLAHAAAVIIQFPASKLGGWRPATVGLTEEHVFTGPNGREITVFARPPRTIPAGGEAAVASPRPDLDRLVIVDPCLGGARGHFEPYARQLAEGAGRLGADVVWAGHARLREDADGRGVEIRRCFARCYFDLDSEQVSTTDLSDGMVQSLLALVDEFDGAGTHFLVHSADGHLLRAFATLFRSRPVLRSTFHISFYNSPRRMPGRAAGVEAHRAAMRLRRDPRWERSLFFWSENGRLGAWLSRWLGTPIPTLPFLAPSGLGAGVRRRTLGDRLVVSFLGESRPEKGFGDLPAIARAVAEHPSLRDSVRLVIQNWEPVRETVPDREASLAPLRDLSCVEIVDGMLTAEEFDRRLSESDVLLLPYDPDIYDLRSSGILIEGIARGCAIVTRAGTAMEDGAAEGVVRTFEMTDGLMDVLSEILRHHDRTTVGAREAAVRFRQRNTPEQYVRALRDRTAGGTG